MRADQSVARPRRSPVSSGSARAVGNHLADQWCCSRAWWRAFLYGSAMRLPRRRFLQLATGACALPALSRIARAQSYPTRPIRLVVPFPPGGAFDTIGRPWADRMKSLLGAVVIENI